jgi:hypothetical protein
MTNHYIQKPIEIEAVQWRIVNLQEVKNFLGDAFVTKLNANLARGHQIVVNGHNGVIHASPGDYIVRESDGTFSIRSEAAFESAHTTEHDNIGKFRNHRRIIERLEAHGIASGLVSKSA